MLRRTFLVAAVIAALVSVAVLPGGTLAEGAAGGHNVGAQLMTGGLEVESSRVWCSTPAPCTSAPGPDIWDNYTGPGQGFYAFAGAYRHDGATHATPDQLYGECDHYWADASGNLYDDYAYVYVYSPSGLVWLMNSGAESNPNAIAAINASGFGSGGFLKIQGYGQFNNDTDMPYQGTNFTVTIVGTIHHEILQTNNGNVWLSAPNTYGSMTCQTQPGPSLGLYPPYQNQPYVYGEAELESVPK